jgi:hypothetical protein
MKYKVKELKLKINEVTLPKAVKILTPGDMLKINGDGYTEDLRVTSITGSQIKLAYQAFNVLLTTNSFNGTDLEVSKLDDSGKPFGKTTLRKVKSIDIVRNGSVLDTIYNPEEDVKHSNDSKDKEFESNAQEMRNDFKMVMNTLKNGDNLKITTGAIGENDEVDKNTITELLFSVDEVNTDTIDLELINAVGDNSNEYNQIKTFNSVKITPQSLKVDKYGNTLILDISLGGKLSTFYIENVLDFEKTDNTAYDEKEEVDTARDERIKNLIINNPRLIKAMSNKPTLLDRVFGNHKPKGIIPFLNKMGKLGDDASKLSKGNKVEFILLSDTIGNATNNLKRGNTYSGRLKDRDTIEIFISNKVKWIIDLKEGAGDNEFNVIASLILTDIKQGKSISKIKEKADIKITKYDF